MLPRPVGACRMLPHRVGASKVATWGNSHFSGSSKAGAQALFRIVVDDGELLARSGRWCYIQPSGPLQALGSSLRYDGSLSARAREIVICSVAARCGSEHEWYARDAVARSVGVSVAGLGAVQHGGTPRELNEEERAAHPLAVSVLSGEPITEVVMEVFEVDRAPTAPSEA